MIWQRTTAGTKPTSFLDTALQTQRLIQRVEAVYSILPPKHAPGAAGLYAKHKSLWADLAVHLQRMKGLLPEIDRELARCYRNYGRIRSHRDALRLQSNIQNLNAMEQEQVAEVMRYVGAKRTFLEMMERAERVLRQTSVKYSPPPSGSDSGKGRAPKSGARTVGEMLSFGPIRATSPTRRGPTGGP